MPIRAILQSERSGVMVLLVWASRLGLVLALYALLSGGPA